MIGEFIIVHPYAVDCVHWVDELWVREAHPRRDMLWKRLLTCLHVVTLKKTHRIFNWLVVLEHFLWDVILPIDFHIFQDG